MNLTRRGLMQSVAAPFLMQRRAAAPRRPNIVLVLAADFGAWMAGCYGNQEIRTPHIDRLADAGTRMAQCFVCTPAEAPSRATLFTGRTPRRHGLEDAPEGAAQAPPALANAAMISDLLAAAGYRCGFVGRWAMGNDRKPGRGFEYAAVLEGDPAENVQFSVNGSSVSENLFITEILTKYATNFFAEQKKKDKPFFLAVSHPGAGAAPAGLPQRYLDMYREARFASFGIQPAAPNAVRGREYLEDPLPALRRCAAAASALDDHVGALHRRILELGLFDSTLFIFTSVTGMLLGQHGLWGGGRASDPVNMYEEAVRVPMIWSWPGRIPVQSVRPELVSLYDFLPTVCEAAGVEPPAGPNLCGRSYLPLVMQRPLPKKQPWPDLVFGQYLDTEMARDKYYKLVVRESGKGPGELYDIRKDPRERVNLYSDAGFSTVRAALEKRLAAWREACA
mgnify:CR=1 FL=1